MKFTPYAAAGLFLLLNVACSQNQLPLVTLPTETKGNTYAAIIISGDGGWAQIDKALAQYLGQEGIPTLGLNSLRYFWVARSREEVGAALITMLKRADQMWPNRKYILIGFSRGANVLPFMVEGLEDPWRKRIVRIALISPAAATGFEFRLRDWWTNRPPQEALPLLPALERLKGIDLLCLYGKEDEETICPELAGGLAKTGVFPGGHHLDGEYSTVVRDILKGLPKSSFASD